MSVTANGRQETRRVHTIKTPGVHESMGMTEGCLGDGGSEVVVGGCAISLVQTGGFYIGERGGHVLLATDTNRRATLST